MRGVVSVVGRPNVGKSTLFNKLVQKREAITEDTPGVTRDRLYREVEWTGEKFMLVDTGGIDTLGTDKIASNINKQVELALETSDLVLFIVDGREGLTGEDREIASLLKRTGLNIILVVNKIDSYKTPLEVYEFYELGFEKMMVISAEQSLGLGDLLDEILEFLPESQEAQEEDHLTVAIIGKPNVGKSSLLNELSGEERTIVTDIAGTTRDAIDSVITRNDKVYKFIDTAGLRRKRSVEEGVERYSVIRTLSAVDRSDICLLMIDASEGVTEQDTKIAGYAHNNGKALIILVNKWDLIEKDTNTMDKYNNQIRNTLSFVPYAQILFVSVKTGERLNQIFDLIDITNSNYNMRIQTGVLNSVISEAIMMSEPPIHKGQKLKIYYATQVSVKPPKFALFVNNRDLVHFSYLRYLENQIRTKFGFSGTPIVFELRNRG